MIASHNMSAASALLLAANRVSPRDQSPEKTSTAHVKTLEKSPSESKSPPPLTSVTSPPSTSRLEGRAAPNSTETPRRRSPSDKRTPRRDNVSDKTDVSPAGSPRLNSLFDAAMKSGLVKSPRAMGSSAGDVLNTYKAKLAEQQRMIDSFTTQGTDNLTLMEDLRNTTEALRVCGADIVAVREDNVKLKRQATEAEDKVKKMELEINEGFKFVEEIVEYRDQVNVAESDPLPLLAKYDQESLLLIATEMGKKLRILEEERLEAKRYATDAKAAKSQVDSLRKAHKELQDAHLQQAKFIQKLQKQNSEVK